MHAQSTDHVRLRSLRPHAGALYRRGAGRRHRPQFPGDRRSAADLRPHGQGPRFRRLRDVELRGDQPVRGRAARDGGAAGVSLARVPARLHHGQPQGGEDAQGPRRQAHRRPALHPDRGGVHPRPAAGRIRSRSSRVHWVQGAINSARSHGNPAAPSAAQAGIDRAEHVGPLAQRIAGSRRDPGHHRQRPAGGAAHQSGRAAAVSGFPRGRARIATGAPACSRSCTWSPCAATSTSGIRSSRRASTRRWTPPRTWRSRRCAMSARCATCCPA